METKLPSELAAPARRAISATGCTHLEQVAQFSEAELKRMHGIGPKAIEQLRRALDAIGLTFADE